MADQKVYFDKGHGGDKPNIAFDPGAVGNGMRESDLVGKIADYAAAELANYSGVIVKIGPRPSGTTSTARLNPRADAANEWGADLFVSFHINAGGGTGWESFIYTKTSAADDKITRVIHNEISAWFASQGLRDRGQKRESLSVIRRSKMAATLLEFGFIDTDKDAALLKQESKLKEMGVVTANAIAKALGLSRKTTVSKPATPTADPKVGGTCTTIVDTKKLTTLGIMYDNKSYVPLRAIADTVGVDLKWPGGDQYATMNGVQLKTSYNYKGTGYAHSVEVAKAIGYSYSWDNKSNTITLKK